MVSVNIKLCQSFSVILGSNWAASWASIVYESGLHLLAVGHVRERIGTSLLAVRLLWVDAGSLTFGILSLRVGTRLLSICIGSYAGVTRSI